MAPVEHVVAVGPFAQSDRRERITSAVGKRDPLPARAHQLRCRPKTRVEVGARLDRADDRVQRHNLQSLRSPAVIGSSPSVGGWLGPCRRVSQRLSRATPWARRARRKSDCASSIGIPVAWLSSNANISFPSVSLRASVQCVNRNSRRRVCHQASACSYPLVVRSGPLGSLAVTDPPPGRCTMGASSLWWLDRRLHRARGAQRQWTVAMRRPRTPVGRNKATRVRAVSAPPFGYPTRSDVGRPGAFGH